MHGENRGCSGLDKVAFKESEKKTERKGKFFFSWLNMWGNKYEIGKTTEMRKGLSFVGLEVREKRSVGRLVFYLPGNSQVGVLVNAEHCL